MQGGVHKYISFIYIHLYLILAMEGGTLAFIYFSISI